MKFNEYRQIKADKEREIEERIVEYQERLNLLDIPEDATISELHSFFKKNNIETQTATLHSSKEEWMCFFAPTKQAYKIEYKKSSGFTVTRRDSIYDIEEQYISDFAIREIERCFNNEPEPPESEYHRSWWEIFKDKWEMFWIDSITGFVLKVVFTILWIGSALGMLALLLSNTKL